MGKAKVGIYAKETLLIAIGMKDSRINMFIINNTKLLANMITELVKKFNSSVVSSLESLPLATSGLGGGGAGGGWSSPVLSPTMSGGGAGGVRGGERSAVTPRQVCSVFVNSSYIFSLLCTTLYYRTQYIY